MNRTYLNLGLLVVVGGLGAALWLGDRKDDAKKPLTALSPSAVERIAIEHPGSPAIKLAKQDGVWKLLEPVAADTDSFEVSALVGLADTSREGVLEGASNLAELGLDPAAFRITLNDQTLDFGGDEPLKYRKYVRVAGGDVALIQNPSSAALDKDYSDLVSKNLLPEGAAIKRLALPGLSIEQNAAGQWTSAEHADAKASDLQAVVDAWTAAKSMWNGAEPVASVEGGEKVTVTLADDRVLNFVIAARDPQFLLARPEIGVRYTLDKTLAERMLGLPKPAPATPAASPTDLPEAAAPTTDLPAPTP